MDIGKLQIVGKGTMKIPNDYMELSYRMEIVEDKDEGGFVVSYPDLPGCIICGETRESAVVNVLDAKRQGLKHIFKIMIAKESQRSYNEVATNWQQKISKPK